MARHYKTTITKNIGGKEVRVEKISRDIEIGGFVAAFDNNYEGQYQGAWIFPGRVRVCGFMKAEKLAKKYAEILAEHNRKVRAKAFNSRALL